MREPRRILEKIIGNGHNLVQFEQTGEPLEQLVEVLRNVIKCRRTRQCIIDNYKVDVVISPKTFSCLLDIPQINFIESSNRMLEINTTSLKEERSSDDPVTIGNLNSFLKEFYRNLETIQYRLQNDYPNPTLIREMRSEWIDPITEQINTLKKLHGKLTGYFLNMNKVRLINSKFQGFFSSSVNAPPLHRNWPTVEKEIEFYRKCDEINNRWKAIEFDVFHVLRCDGLSNLKENVQEIGNLLWNIVYSCKSVEQCLNIIGIDLANTCSVFDSDRIKLINV